MRSLQDYGPEGCRYQPMGALDVEPDAAAAASSGFVVAVVAVATAPPGIASGRLDRVLQPESGAAGFAPAGVITCVCSH